MQWVGGGVVRIPLRHIYLWALVLTLAYFMARELSLTQKRRHQSSCHGFQQDLILRAEREAAWRRSKPVASPDQHPINGNLAEDELGAHNDEPEQKQPAPKDVCGGDPTPTLPQDCPHCYRPRARTLSKRLQLVSYSAALFPRGRPRLFHLRNTKQHSYIEDYVITPTAVCRTDRPCPYLLVLQLSVAQDTERRQAVRTTWGSVAKTQAWPHAHINGEVQILFVLAHPTGVRKMEHDQSFVPNKKGGQADSAILQEIRREADQHGDILYINMADSYHHLTMKLMSAFKWVKEHCPSVKFVLKVDTDTFVNVPLLLDMLLLNEERLKFSIMGTIYTEERTVHRVGKWAVNSTVYPPPIYPIYASGCSYVLSADTMQAAVLAFPYVPLIEVEDAFVTGILGRVLGVQHVQAPRGTFTHMDEQTWRPLQVLLDKRITGTGMETPEHFLTVWALILTGVEEVVGRNVWADLGEEDNDGLIRRSMDIEGVREIVNATVRCGVNWTEIPDISVFAFPPLS